MADEDLKAEFLATRKEESPLTEFCKKCREMRYCVYEMDLISAGEEFYAAMKRSTNGGGENEKNIDTEKILELLASGLSKKEVAQKLGISTNTLYKRLKQQKELEEFIPAKASAYIVKTVYAEVLF